MIHRIFLWLRKLLQTGHDMAVMHGLNPAWFVVMYVATFFLAGFSASALAWAIAQGMTNIIIYALTVLTVVLFFAPSLTCIFFAKDISWKVYLLFFTWLSISAVGAYGIGGIQYVVITFLVFMLYRFLRFRTQPIKVKLQLFDPEDYIQEIATGLMQDYWQNPWRERYICCCCTSFHDFDPAHKFDEPGKCPTHERELALFWSPARTAEYIRQAKLQAGFKAFGAFDQERNLVGFCWTFEKVINDQHTDYLDVIYVSPKQRRHRSLLRTVVDALVCCCLRFGNPLFMTFYHCFNTSVFVRLYFAHLSHARARGMSYVSLRTSTEHDYLQVRARMMGYRALAPDPKDPTRVYYLLSNPVLHPLPSP